MAGFDPKAYLAAKESAPSPSGGFDPVAYLAEKDGDDTVVQEMHPAFSTADRLIVKNFSNDDEGAAGYLRKQHPDLDIKTSPYTGQIMARGRGETDYKVLDPDNTLFESLNPLRSETWRDIGDAGADIVSGVGTSAATAAGGIAGALGSFGVGAVPAAMAAGAGAGAGLESLRQLAGNALGIDQDFDVGNVAWAGGLGAASPLLLGTGATATQIATKSLNPFAGSLNTLKGTAAPLLDDAGKAAMKAQRGLFGIGYDGFKSKIAPKLAAEASGVSPSAIKGLSEQYDDFIKIEADPLGRVKFAQETAQDAGSKLRTAKQGKWNEFEEAVDMVPKDTRVNLSAAQNVFDEAIAKANEAGDPALANRLKEEYRHFFQKSYEHRGTVVPQMIPDPMIPSTSAGTVVPNGVMDDMVPSIDPSTGAPRLDPVMGNVIMEPRSSSRVTFQTIRGGGGQIDPTTGMPIMEASGIDPMVALQQLGGGTMYEDLGSVPIKQALQIDRRLADTAGFGKMKPGDIKGGIGNRFGAADTFEDKAVMEVARAAKNALGDTLNTVLPEGALAKRAEYGEIANLERSIKPLLKSEDAVLKTMRNLGNESNVGRQQKWAEIDRRHGTDLIKRAEMEQAQNVFANPSLLPISKNGVSGRARAIPLAAVTGGLGYLAGANSGIGQGGAGVGAVAGAGLGAMLGGPAAIRRYIQMQRLASRNAGKLRDLGIRPNQTVIPSWLLMQQRSIEE